MTRKLIGPGKLKTQCEIVIIIIIICLVSLFSYNNLKWDYFSKININDIDKIEANNLKLHKIQVETLNEKRQNWVTSNLGSILFKFEHKTNYQGPRQNRTFTVLIWKHWGWLKNRHIYEGETLGDCSVQNCKFSGDYKLINTADAVLIHIQKGDFPVVDKRNFKQRWVFLNDESPRNAFSMAKTPVNWRNLANVFNWSMTFRSDSDVPVPYGRTVPLSGPRIPDFVFTNEIKELIPNWNRKKYNVLATVLMSNCGVKRRADFIKNLSKYIKVDVYGKCGDTPENKNRCPGHFKSDCEPISDYLFYLVLENSMCTQYITEKIFYHAYMRGAIPVIMGMSREDCETLLPPNSYLYYDDTIKIEDLAQEMLSISENPNMLLSYHMWRNHFKVLNEHGYFGTRSYHLCRLCEALNYNDENVKVYDEKALERFLDPNSLCTKY